MRYLEHSSQTDRALIPDDVGGVFEEKPTTAGTWEENDAWRPACRRATGRGHATLGGAGGDPIEGVPFTTTTARTSCDGLGRDEREQLWGGTDEVERRRVGPLVRPRIPECPLIRPFR